MKTTPVEPLTVSVEEACLLLGLGRTSGYVLAKRGDLPGAIRLGRRIRVSRAMLEQALGISQVPERCDEGN
jgi:excisionase family DNA binding protein